MKALVLATAIFVFISIILYIPSVKADCTYCTASQIPRSVQLVQTIASGKDLYILWSGYDSSSQHNAILLSTSQDGGSSFKIKDLAEFGIGSVDKMQASNESLYLISKNTVTESKDSGNSFGQPVVLNGEGNSAVSDMIASGTNVYALIDDVIKNGNAFQILFSASNDSGTTFSTPIKLFGMPETSQDYSQIAAVKNNVYVVAEGKYVTPAGPVGVLFKKSNDGGTTFSNTFDLANDSSVDFAPKIAASGHDVYAVWSELGSKGAQLYFRSSQDYGQTFGPAIKLSKEPDFGTTDSDFPRVLPGNNSTVYVAWWSVHFENQTETDSLLFRKSDDGGKTFGDTTTLSGKKTSPEDLGHNTVVVASGKNVYAMWMSYYDVQSVDNVQVLFTKSNDGGDTFSDPIDININSLGPQMGAQNPQIVSSGNDVYVAWDTGNSNQEIQLKKGSGGIAFNTILGFDVNGTGNTNGSLTVYPSPLKQSSSGIGAHDIKCNAGLEMVLKAENSAPACVRQETASKLILRGWASKIMTNTEIVSQPNPSQTSSNGPDFKIGPDLLGPIPHQLVFFMKSNSTAKIFVEYTSREPNTGTMKSWASIYTGNATNYTPLDTSEIDISGNPPSIPLTDGSDTIVAYTINAKEGVKGVYWLFLAQFCGLMPVAIDIDSFHLSPSDIPLHMGMRSCPAQFLDAKILGISGGTAEYKIAQPVS